MAADDDIVSSRSVAPLAPGSKARRAWLVRLPQAPVVAPAACASCGQPASRETRLRDGKAHEFFVGYCEACARARGEHATRRLAKGFSALLVAGSLALALPIALPWQALWTSVALSFAGGLLPLLVGWLFARRAAAAQRGSVAAWFRAPGELACRRQEFALEFAAQLGVTVETFELARSGPPPEAWLVAAVAAILAPVSHAFHHPLVRVLDLGPRPFDLVVDGHPLGRVEPSSSESPLAGRDLRVPAGSRDFVARDVDGVAVAAARVDLHAGERHLYAPGNAEVCFWLESVGYGRERSPTDSTLLEGPARFWLIPADVNGWFMPAAPATESSRVSGGRTTVLRQGPCDEAPAAFVGGASRAAPPFPK